MRRTRVTGVVLYLGGLLLVVFPFLGVAALQRQVTDDVPLPDGADVVIEDTTVGAIFDDDFVLASARVDASAEQVEQSLASAGFERSRRTLEGRMSWVRAGGRYDGVIVAVFEGPEGMTGLRYSVIDDDLRVTWPVLSGIGLLLGLAGVALARSGRRSTDSTRVPPARQTPISAH